MKIIIIITGLKRGGAETILFELLKILKYSSLNLHVISLTGKGVVYNDIIELGVPVSVVGGKRGSFSILSFFRLLSLLREIKPDIVHTWMYHADLFGGLAAKAAGINKIIWSIHNTNLDKDKTKIVTRMIVRMCIVVSSWVPSDILSCSKKSSQEHIRIGYPKRKMVIIPNGFDTSRYRPTKEFRKTLLNEISAQEDIFLIGHMGRYDPVKNHIGFIRAASILHKKIPKTRFILAGDGVDGNNKELNALINSLGISKMVHMLGYRSDTSRIIPSLDILVSSSHGEAFPLVVGEAMSCEVSCVVTDVGDSSYLVGNTGKVVRPNNIHELSGAIESLLQMKVKDRQYLGKIARRRIIENFDIRIVAKQYKVFYENVVSKGI